MLIGDFVVPRDEQILDETCRTLTDQALREQVAVRYMDAATALACVNDPVAVPYLQRIAESNRAQSVAIEGLARIDTPEARAALETLSRSTLPHVAQAAQGQLRMLASKR